MLLELKADLEPAIHDARVAMRKLRSTLAVHSPALNKGAKSLRRELTWLAGVLGPARDAQVVLERVRAGVDALPEAPESAELVHSFGLDVELAFTTARVALESERVTDLVARLDVARLRSMVTSTSAADPVGNLERVVRDLQAAQGADDERLHDLRKTVKRVRYVRGVHDDIDAALRRVQGILGEHQDSVVTRERLAARPPSPLLGQLVERERAAAEDAELRLAKAVRKLGDALPDAPEQ